MLIVQLLQCFLREALQMLYDNMYIDHVNEWVDCIYHKDMHRKAQSGLSRLHYAST